MDTLQELNSGLKIDLEKDTLHYIRKSFHDMHIISYNRLGTEILYIYIYQLIIFVEIHTNGNNCLSSFIWQLKF